MLYGLANRHTTNGVIVELGSFCGGSASFFAKGLVDKKDGPAARRVVCVDPLLSAPPWLALPPHFFTMTEMQSNITVLGLQDRIDFKVGDSAAVGAVWPAEAIDILLIDGDHSFEGALRDFECWAPKLRMGGVLLFDDIDNIPEMRSLHQLLLHMPSLESQGTVDGIGVYLVRGDGWKILEDLKLLLAAEEIFRPWSYEAVHTKRLIEPYRRTHKWTEPALELAYDLGYLCTAAGGDYAILSNTPSELQRVVRSVHADRGQGDMHVINDINNYGRLFRLVACAPEDAPKALGRLVPGGVVLAWSETPLTTHDAGLLVEAMRRVGLEGVSHGGEERPLFWGVADIAALSPLQVMQGHMNPRGFGR